MLIGNFLAKLDTKKGRTALPVNFRRILGKTIIITAGYEHSLMIISKNSWEKVVGNIINKSFLSATARDTDRFLLGSAFELTLDDQGRFILPLTLRTHAGLGEDIVFIGVGNRIEIWSKEQWQKHSDYLRVNSEKIAQELEKNNNE